MDPAGNKGSELERRISTRNSVRISINGVDDDFDVAGMVSDGFRPPQLGSGVEPQTPSASSGSSASPPAVAGGDPGQSPANLSPPRPSSASKPHRPHESLSLRHDGGMGSIEESSSSLTRTSSLSTESHAFVPGPESPYQGPSGPSHPYGMYTQNVRAARTMSMTTSSTEPISESSYNGLRAPAHPYTLYTQDTITEAGNVPPAPIPLGFHGLPDSYQRRIGPEGEDLADIIGPDGHTEQLPPYSRYPDEAYARKVRDVEEARPSAGGGATIVPAAASLRTSGFQTIPGAGGIGLATRNPEFESMDDLGSPQSRHSSRSFTSDGSHHEINMAAAAVSEKGQAAKPLHNWMRRRVWGIIPVWSILLTVVVLILMSVILGSVIGAFMSKQKKGPRGGYQEPSTSSTATYTFGATPIPTPTDLPPLPTGNFSMPLMTSRVLSACFADTTLAQAWQCHLVISGLRLSIAKTKEDSLGDYAAAITCDTSHTVANSVYSYGEQPFLIEKPAALELVNDTLDTGRGPAWFKMISYNKTVIVPEGSLTPDGPKHRLRSAGKYPMGSGDFKRKGIISEGAKPWICNWPESYLEIFIYAQQNSSIGAITMKPQPLPSQSPTASLPSSTVPSGRTEGSVAKTNAPGWQNGYQDGPKPTDKPVDKPTGTMPGAETTTLTTTDSTSTGVFGPIDANDNFTPPPPAYPRVIKIEERHMHGRQRPTCTKVEIQDMGEPAKPVKGPDGKPIIVEIEETAPRDHDMGDLSRRSSPLSERDGPGSPSQCGCVWFLT